MLTCADCGRENAEDARFCQYCGAAVVTAPASEQRKVVTVVFTDVTGSTDLGEQLDPETMRGVITRYFDAMAAVIERHGGTVEKFIGDAVMAVFGVPQVHEDDALRAVRAAVDMRDALAALNETLHAERAVTIATRTGIHTGEVMAGDASSRERFVSGDTVNVAARLEQAAAPGETLLGATTYQLVRDAVQVEPVAPLSLKGKSAPVEAYRLVAVRADASGRERHMDAPMVGRKRQLRMARDSFEAAVEDRTCTMFTVLGSPGVGKTRLVEEFLSGVADQASVHRGRCLSYGDGITFWPIDEIVRSICGIVQADDVARLSAALRDRLRGADEAEPVATAVEGLLGLRVEPVDLQDGFWAVRRLLEHAAREHPLVVLFDDIHWAEPALLDLIEHLADWSREAPILLLCTARPELLDVRPNWGGGKSNAATTLLEPLSAEDAGVLLDNLLGSELPLEARERIVAGAEGNPLFVEEMLGMLVDQGVLVAEADAWVVRGEIADVAVPDSIHALISARLDRLGREERIVIERGAVEGKLFHLGGVSALAPELVSVQTQLMTLVRKELIRPDRADFAGDEAFRFRHLLIRDTAYESLPKQTRADLHARFGEWLAGHEMRAGGMDAIVAHHFDQAQRYLADLGGNEARAAELGGLAAERYAVAAKAAVEHGDDRGAITLYERAVALSSPLDPFGLEVRVELAEAMLGVARYEEADAILGDVERVAGDEGQRLIALHAAAGLLSLKDAVATDWSDARFVGESERIEAGLRELGDRKGAVDAVLLRVNWLPRAEGETLARSAAAEAAELGDRSLEGRALSWLHATGLWGMRPADELERALRATLGRPLPNRGMEGMLRAQLGSVLAMLARFDEGSTEIERGLAIAHELGQAREIGLRGFFRGMLLEYLRGDLETAVRIIRRAVEDFSAIGEQNRRSSLAAVAAWMSARVGDVANAEDLLQIAMDAATPNDDDTHSMAAQARSVIASGRGQHDEAIAQAREAVRLQRQRATFWVGEDLVTLADAFSAAGDLEGEIIALRDALDIFEAKGVVPRIEDTRSRLAALAG